jgi:apolipoprotein N-acyltransferase
MPRLLLPLVSLGSGALAALGFAPLDLWPLTLLGLAGLMWLVGNAGSGWRAAGHGWLFGTALFSVSLNWIATAFTFQSKMDPALGWAAVVGLAAYLALFIALPSGLAAALVKQPLARSLALAGLWIPAEWLRGHALTGFAWNPLGAMWLPVPGVPQLAALFGALGLSLLALLAAAGLLWLVRGPGRGVRLAGGALVAVIAVAGLLGQTRITMAEVSTATLVVVQPGIGQAVRYDPAAAARNFQTYLAITREAMSRKETMGRVDLPDARIREVDPGGLDGIESPLGPMAGEVTGNIEIPLDAALAEPPDPDVIPGVSEDRAPAVARAAQRRPVLVLWPEGALDSLPERDAGLRATLGGLLESGDFLLTGGTGIGTGSTPYANSLFVLDSTGRIIGRYDKAHLVPGGEYLPWRDLLEPLGLARLVPGDFDFAAGPGPVTLRLPGLIGVAPVICYEIAFPGAVASRRQRPGWIANISNDAWFGAWGPPQHLAQARLRAIEEGLPVARATPTGISAVIDAHGQIGAVLPAGDAGALVAGLPPPLPPTPFVSTGPWLALAAALATLAAALLLGRAGRATPAQAAKAI